MMLNRRFLGVLAGLTLVVTAFGQGAFSFKINEVVVSNTDGLVDEYGNRAGWIEIANTSWGTNNIRSCYLTTQREALNKELSVPERVRMMSLIPKGDDRTNLTAQKRIVFFADGRTNLGTLHTNFELKPGEENFIALFDGNGKTLLDSITVPPLAENQSYARVYDAESDAYVWVVLNADEVTPGSPNVGQGKVQDKVAEFKEKFRAQVGNDLNTSMGVTALYDALKAKTNGATRLAILDSFDRVLSLSLLDKAAAVREEQKKQKTASQGGYAITGEGDPAVDALVLQRYEAKKARNFAEADRIRDELKAQGIEVTDLPGGASWKRV